MSWLPEDVREASGGEHVDRLARDAIRLAHRALDRFPDLVRRHKYVAGGAAISTSLVLIAGVAIARRMKDGQTAEEAVASVTEDELNRPVREEEPAVGAEAPDAASTSPELRAEQGPEAAAQEAGQPLVRSVHSNGASRPSGERESSESR
jgi:hypothetical protein